MIKTIFAWLGVLCLGLLIVSSSVSGSIFRQSTDGQAFEIVSTYDFASNGITVASLRLEYPNVESIRASLTPGIFIIRVTKQASYHELKALQVLADELEKQDQRVKITRFSKSDTLCLKSQLGETYCCTLNSVAQVGGAPTFQCTLR